MLYPCMGILAEFYLSIEHTWPDKIMDVNGLASRFIRCIWPGGFSTNETVFGHRTLPK